MNCCGEASSRAEAFAQIAFWSPDAVILDLSLPDGSGLDVIKWIRKHSATMAILMLTMSEEPTHVLSAMNSGASAYVKKSAPLSEVIASLKAAIAQPGNFTAPGMAYIIHQSVSTFDLTAREISVLKVLSLAGTNKELAKQLFISEATFKSHLAAIYQKMKVPGRIGALNKAREFNIL